MKVLIPSYEKTFDGKMDRSFGRAQWFVLVDTESGDFQAYSNKQNFDAPQGAGIQAAQNVVDLKAEAVLVGNIGPKALKVLQAASVAICQVGKECETVREAFEEWKRGALQEISAATVESHWV